MPKRRIPILTASAIVLIAICITVLAAWDIFPGAMSQTLDNATQDQVSAEELSAAVEAQRQDSAKLTRSATFDQRLQKLIEKARKKGTVSVMVKVRAAFRPEGQISSAAETLAQRQVIREAQDQMLSWLRYVPYSLKRYDYLPYITASVDEIGLRQLQASSEALDISENKPLRLATAESLPRIGAQRAWAGQFTGAGKTIAVIDSGVDKNHSWLSGKVVSEACYSTTDEVRLYSSVCPSGIAPTDPGSGIPCAVPGLDGVGNCGHGTHIAGIAAGRGGVAYAADIISIQVMSRVDDSEACRGQIPCLLSDRADVVSALNRVYELRDTYAIAAVNISLAGDSLAFEPFPNTCDDEYQAMTDAINLLRSVNIATVIASGNDGATDAISFPACISPAISVGATGDGSAPTAPNDTVLQNSNSASFLSLLAPGSFITSSVPGGGVASGFGTSQAAAHVSGAWAMLKEKYHDATVDQVLNKLMTFGVNITDSRSGVIKPRIQIDAALEVTVPPETWIGEYYNNINLDGGPVLVRDDGGGVFIDRYYNGQSPAPGFVGAENYSVRWTRKQIFTQGNYRFSVTGDDGVRLYIDDQLIINAWGFQSPTSYNADVSLSSGPHDIKLEYFQGGVTAQARLIWGIFNPQCSQAAPADHWKGEYFNNANLAGSPVRTSDDGSSDSFGFNWGGGAPGSGCNLTIFPDHFSVRWTRWVNLAQGTYRFTVTGDDWVRLLIDDQLWFAGSGTQTVGVPITTSGNHKIVLEFTEVVGGASVSLSWAPVCQVSVVVVSPAVYQSPDPGQGGSLVSSPYNAGHGDTSVSASVPIGANSALKTCMWQSFPGVSGTIQSITLKFDYVARGSVGAFASDEGDSSIAHAWFGVQYSLDNGANWLDAFYLFTVVTAGPGGQNTDGFSSPNFPSTTPVSVSIPANTPISQIKVRDALGANANRWGFAEARAETGNPGPTRVENIRLEIVRITPVPCVP